VEIKIKWMIRKNMTYENTYRDDTYLKQMESEVKYGDKTMTNSISHGKLKDEIHGCMDSKS
jgi:hypothetical protein